MNDLSKLCILLIVGLLLLTTNSFSQSCQQKLGDATKLYYSGKLREIDPLLSGCLSELNKEDQLDALKVLLNTSLLLNDDLKSDFYMNELLKLNPYYEVRDDELAEFKSLYSSYEMEIKYMIGFSVGIVYPDYHIMRYQSISGQTIEPDDYDEIPGVSIGVTGDVHIWNGFYFNSSILYSQRSFKQEEIIMDYQRVASYERDQYLDLPLQIRYIFNLGKVDPFLGGGYALHYLIKAKGDIDHVPLEPDFPSVIGIPVLTDDYDLTELRRRFTHNWTFLLGALINFQKFQVEVRGSYQLGINNQVDPASRNTNRELVETFAYIPDDYRIDSYVFSLVFSRNFVRPKKISR